MKMFTNSLFVCLLLSVQTQTVRCNVVQKRTTSKENEEILQLPFAYLNKLMNERFSWYTNRIPDVMKSIYKYYTNQSQKLDCTTIFYRTEENLVEIIIRELLNSMYLTVEKKNEKNVCNTVENWLESLVNTFKTEVCENIFLNNLLFDMISALCKQTNKQVQISIDNIKDLLKSNDQLIDECIQCISNYDFINGERKIQLITNDNHITYIVKKVYNSNVNNFDKILTFFNNIGNARKVFIAYNFLYEQLENEVHPEGNKLYKLYANLERILNRRTYPIIETEVTFIQSNLKKKLITFVADELFEGYRDEKSLILPESDTLVDIYKHFKIIYFEGFKYFLFELCGKLNCNATYLMDFAWRRNFYGEIILGLNAIFDELQLNDDEKLTFGYHLYRLSNIEYKSSQKEKLELLKARLPKSTKNLLFSKYVCIKNIAFDEYLITENKTITNYTLPYNNTLVFTVDLHAILPNAIWEINCPNISCRDTFHLKNLAYNKVHLYASKRIGHNYHHPHIVHTAQTIDNNFNYDLWIIEPFDDYCYIKNFEHNAYIYVDDEIYSDNGEHHIFTWIPNHSKITSKKFQWFVEDCTVEQFFVEH